jgi:hypothetical protein
MFHILFGTFEFVAILAGPHTAKVALPLSAEKSATICLCVWARPYESGALGCGGSSSISIRSGAYTNAVIDALFFGGDVASTCFEFGDFGGEFRFFVAESILAPDEFSNTLAGRKKRFFFLEHNHLAMFFPILCHEFLSEVFHQKFACKFFVAFHTIGDLICGIKYDGGVALTTGFESTRLAGYGNMR